MDTDKNKLEKFDVAVIGGGAAGMMAAIWAAQDGARVVLVEKNKTLGKKLLMTGNGRCNLTHAHDSVREFVEKIGKNGKFLFSSLSTFGPDETMDWFGKLDRKTRIEPDGRVFPVSDKAQDVLHTLGRTLTRSGVKIMFEETVLGFKIKDKKVEYVETASGKIHATNFILATGGKSYPATGSTGDGYRWMENIGHTVNLPAPALAPVKMAEAWVKNLQGITLPNVGLSLVQNDHKANIGRGEMIFTHFGVSGPAIINASRVIGEYLQKGAVFLEIDLLPEMNLSTLEEKLKKDFGSHQNKDLKNYLAEMFPQKLAKEIAELIGLGAAKKINSISKPERISLARLIKGVRTSVSSLLGFNSAMVTSGGVSLKEVDPKTMRSKLFSNLFFAGEILDLDGPTGGYNLQIAWTTGRTAGVNARGEKKKT